MNVLICGTNYGATYLRALSISQGHVLQGNVKAAGILSTGSDRSVRLAQQANIPHYTQVEEIEPNTIDIACIAIPGEIGHQIALKLLEKGIHVLCEHPIAAKQMRSALDVAHKHHREFFVNAHFADLYAPQCFLQSLETANQIGHCLHYDLAVNLRTLYSGLDLLGRATGTLTGYHVTSSHAIDKKDKNNLFASVRLESSANSVSLLCQNFASQQDDGSATLLNHRFSATFIHGNLLLAESNGPVMWFPSPVSMEPQHWKSYLPVEMNSVTQSQLLQQRDGANLFTLQKMAAKITGGDRPREQAPGYLIELATLWEQILHLLQPAKTEPSET